MGGLCGVVSNRNCLEDLLYGTDYHSHLGNSLAGIAVVSQKGCFQRSTHRIANTSFRSKFEIYLREMEGKLGIGCISDGESQPLLVRSRLGSYAIAFVGRINNIRELAEEVIQRSHFLEISENRINPVEIVAALIDQSDDFGSGIRTAQETIDGSCSLLVLIENELYAARDRFGRTPLIIGEKDGSFCVVSETCALLNLGYKIERVLGPGEIVRITTDGVKQINSPGNTLKICAFLWVYYGFPASSYEGINVEEMRNRSGRILAFNDNVAADIVVGIPDSGLPYAIGYANQSGIPLARALIKYTQSWQRSFMPDDADLRRLIAGMKLIPARELIENKRIVLCDDSIVRGTQLRGIVQGLYDCGAREVHMRVACPPIIYGCNFLNFSQSEINDLVARHAINQIGCDFSRCIDSTSEEYRQMVGFIRQIFGFSSLRYQTMEDMVRAIGLPKENICTYCWDGKG